MQSLYPANLPTLEQVWESSPLNVLPDTLLIDAIACMNLGSSSTSDLSSCILIVAEKTLLGILTLRDVVRLIGARVNLSQIPISEVMTQPVISLTLAGDQNAITALSVMQQHSIRHLPVVDELGQLLGLITQDKIREVIQPAHLLKLQCVTEVMTTEVISALPTTSVWELSQIMSDRHISCVVIVAEDETKLLPVGIITEKDIIKIQLQRLDIAQMPASAVMSTPVFSISPTASLWTVHQLMQQRGVRRLVVVDEQGQLQGLVTQTNLLQGIDPLEIVKIIQVLQAKVAEQTVQLTECNQQLEQEISQRRQAEESLRQAQEQLELRVAERTNEILQANVLLQQREQQWQALFDHALDAIAITDDQGQYVEVNPAACELFGASREELLGSTIGDFTAPGFDFTQAWQQFCEQGQMLGEFSLHRPDGTVRETEFAAVANFIPHRHLAILRDVSDRQAALRSCQQAEANLQTSEQRLNLALTAGKIGIWDWNLQTNQLFWSESLFTVFGLTPETFEVNYDNFLNLIVHPEDRQRVHQSLARAINQEAPHELEFRFIHPDGTVRWSFCKGKVFYDDTTNQPLQMIGVNTEITERKQAETALRKAQESLEIAIEAAQLGTWYLDLSADFSPERSLRHDQIFGYATPQTEWGWKIFKGHVIEEDRKICHTAFARAIETGKLNFEVRIKWADGSIHWMVARGRFYFDDNGNPLYAVGVNFDITDLKEVETALQESEQRLKLALSASNTGIWDWNLQTSEIIWSESMCSLFNIDPQAFDGKLASFFNFIHPEDREFVEQSLMQFIDEQGICDIEFRVVWRNGTVHWAHGKGKVFCDETGQPVRMIGVHHDITERKQIEKALRISEQRLQGILDNSSVLIYLIDSQNRHLLGSRSYAELVGTSSENLLGKSIYDFWPTEAADTFASQNQHVLTTNQLIKLEETVPHKNGLHSYLTVKFPLLDTDGKPYAVCGISTNITEHKQAEQILKNIAAGVSATTGQTFFYSLVQYLASALQVDYAFVATIAHTPTPRMKTIAVFGNGAVINNVEYDLVNTPCNDVITQKVCIHTNNVQQEFPLDTLLADLCVECYIGAPLFDSNGSVLGLIAAMHRQKLPQPQIVVSVLQTFAARAAAELERQQAQHKIEEQAALIDLATDAIFVRDLEKRVLFWSQGAERLYGWTAEESLGRKADEFVCRGTFSQLAIGLQETLAKGFWQGEVEQVTKDGRKIIVSSRWSLVENKFGQSQSILVVNTDITEKKQLEAQFYRAQRLESIGTLASGIAHDLNNVFAPMMMIAQLLPSRCPNADAKTKELFTTIETSSKRGADLVRQILTFARGTEGKRILLQPGHLLNELVNVIQQTFPKSIEIFKNIPTDTLWKVEAEPTQLEQVFMNLAVNARDAMPNGGKLTITAENRSIDQTYARMHLEAEAGDYIVVSVLDTGAGIPPEFLERIFDPFFTTKEVGKGTGLGLSTVLGIVKNHGGFVEVSSQVGKGTKFQVFLPRGEGTTTEIITNSELPRGNGELILVVDDEVVVRQTTQVTLADYNYQTLVANDGIEAIAFYAEHQKRISAVLLDMVMPYMDGLTAIRILRTINSQVKIIATSGLPTNEPKALALGAVKFLSKPYTARDLLHSLADAIDQ